MGWLWPNSAQLPKGPRWNKFPTWKQFSWAIQGICYFHCNWSHVSHTSLKAICVSLKERHPCRQVYMLVCFELLYNVQDHAPQAWKPSHRNVRCWPKVMAEASAGAFAFPPRAPAQKNCKCIDILKRTCRDASQMLRQKSLSLREFIPNLQSTYSTKDLDLQNFPVMGIWIIWANIQMDTIVEYIIEFSNICRLMRQPQFKEGVEADQWTWNLM